ncbi:hypothetical protein B0I35DRAFT_445762 [Stachybotrys elegans]|uniref:Uncharacterized protein n=1 Tax=Stachybotrys elegans TaxID=80388 RepID=A0A8K0WK14_9HYPO|nr:hypothetical protein B0I35DRAFT_445762 [Stachybotrys elegans]
MTTNSFGTALPRFDFQPAPAIAKQARLTRFSPLTTVAGIALLCCAFVSAQATPHRPAPVPLHVHNTVPTVRRHAQENTASKHGHDPEKDMEEMRIVQWLSEEIWR